MNRLTFAGVIALSTFGNAITWSQTNPGGTQTGNEPPAATQQQTNEPAQVGGQANVQGTVQGTLRRVPDYGGISRQPWFSNSAVREQLQLDENRFNRLNEAYGRAWRQYNQNVTGLGDDLADDIRQQRMAELREDFNRDFGSARDTVFNDPRIRSRYDQLQTQYRGYSAFNDPDVQRRLNLTPEQRQQIGQFRDEWNAQMGEVEQLYATDPDTASERYRQLQLQSQERLGTTLTPDQRRQWSEAIGDRFDFPADTYFEDSRTVRRPNRRLPDRARR
jgi:hypothetical protein